MHPVSSIVRAAELHQHEILSEACQERLRAQAVGQRPRAHGGSFALMIFIAVVLVLAVFAATTVNDPVAVLHTIEGSR